MNFEESISIRLGQLSRKLNISNSKIVSLFKDLGITIEDNSNTRIKLIHIDPLLEKIRLIDGDYYKYSPENFSKFISDLKLKESNRLKIMNKVRAEESLNILHNSNVSVDIGLNKEYRYIRFYEELKEENEKEKLIQFLSYMHKDFNKNGGGQELIDYDFLLKNIEGKFLMNSSKNVIKKAFHVFLEKKMTKNLIKEIVNLGNQSLFNSTSELLTSSQEKFKSPTNSTIHSSTNKKSKKRKSISYKEYSELKQKIETIKNRSNYFSKNSSFKSESEEKIDFQKSDASNKIYSGVFKPTGTNSESEEDPIHRK
jgi:hypothetical protein